MARVPLAWLNLVHEKRRFLVSVAGIAFAVLLMFMQIGFLNALLDGTVEVIRWLDADLVLISKSKYSLSVNSPFPRRRIYQAKGIEGVASGRPLYIEYRHSLWKTIEESGTPPRHIRVLAFDPARPALLMPEVVAQASLLEMPNTALIDERSKREFAATTEGVERELASRDIDVVGTFTLGTDFVNDGNVILSDRNYAKFFPHGASAEQTLSFVEVGLIKIEEGTDPYRVQQALRTGLDRDVQVLTKNEFLQLERNFWLTHAPIGFIFGLGTAIGFIVGTVICYQILSADVADHLSEYATLKAIGYHDYYLSGVVLQEGVLLSLLGFVPGFACAAFLYDFLDRLTGLPMRLSWERGALILVLTVMMCIVSGLLALRKVQAADPAEVF